MEENTYKLQNLTYAGYIFNVNGAICVLWLKHIKNNQSSPLTWVISGWISSVLEDFPAYVGNYWKINLRAATDEQVFLW